MSNNVHQDWIGKKYVDDRERSIDDDDDDVLLHSDLPVGTRVIGHDTFVTMDYVPERLNVYIDTECVVTKVKYG